MMLFAVVFQMFCSCCSCVHLFAVVCILFAVVCHCFAFVYSFLAFFCSCFVVVLQLFTVVYSRLQLFAVILQSYAVVCSCLQLCLQPFAVVLHMFAVEFFRYSNWCDRHDDLEDTSRYVSTCNIYGQIKIDLKMKLLDILELYLHAHS